MTRSNAGRIASLVDAVHSSARQERAETADIDVPEQIRSAPSPSWSRS